MTTKIFLLILAIVASLMLASCASTSSTNTSISSLNHTSWELATLNDEPVIPDSLITIRFENDKITGSDGCNHYQTSYTLNADKLSINKKIASTMMACPEPIMQQASAYTKALAQVTSYKINGLQLILLNASGNTLAIFVTQSEDLAGTSWGVTSSNNGKQAVVSVVNGSKLTANFSADGKISGTAGCNNYTAHYEVSGKTIKINSVAATRKMCAEPTGVMEQEAQFLKALETASTYQFDGKQLHLRTANNALAIILVAANTLP